jgi:hypothetical protein
MKQQQVVFVAECESEEQRRAGALLLQKKQQLLETFPYIWAVSTALFVLFFNFSVPKNFVATL